MPIRKPCRPGCPHVVTSATPCPVHGRHEKPSEQVRETSNARGYNYHWQQYTKRFLARNPLCAHCEKQGKIQAATLVDHIVPVQNAKDPRFYQESNHQQLCASCHALKTIEDQRLNLTRKS